MKNGSSPARLEPSIRVLVSDPSGMGCELLGNALMQCPDRFDVVCGVTRSAELLQATSEHKPDVVIVSAVLSDGPLAGINVLRDLHTKHSESRLIVILDADNSALVVDAFRGGASAVLFRADPFDSLCDAVRRVHKGQVWASSNALQFMIEVLVRVAPVRTAHANGVGLLTKREEEVANLVASGLSNRRISEQLHLSEHTVKNYLFRIFDKLGISSRVELILLAATTQRKSADSSRHVAA